MATERIPVPEPLRTQFNQIHLLALEAVKRGISKAIDDFRGTWMDALKEEFSQGVSLKEDFVCVVARKP